MNIKAVDASLDHLYEVPVGEPNGDPTPTSGYPTMRHPSLKMCWPR